MILIRNVRLVDARGERGPADVLIGEGRILSLEGGEAKQVVDGTGCFLAPGFLDLHAHLREPGEEVKEDLFSGLLAAVRGGYTDLVSMPNTKPPVDTPEAVRALKEKAKALGLVNRIAPPGKALEEAKALAEEVAKNAPTSLRLTKELLLALPGMGLEDGFRLAALANAWVRETGDLKEGIRAFFEKRPPRF